MALIEVIIGLVFVFSLLSILVTQINSFIASLLRWRAKQLKEGLIKLVADKQLQAEILAHPLINMVEKTEIAVQSLQVNQRQVDKIVNSPATDVEYIDSKTFTEALMSILIVRSYNDLYMPLQAAIEAMPPSPTQDQLRDLFREFQADISDVKLRQIRGVILGIPNNASLVMGLEQTEAAYASIRYRSEELAPLIAGARNIENPAFQRALEVLLATAKNLDDARSKLEVWFNDGMTRTSALYQSKIQYVSFLVGLVLVILLNIDTLNIGRALWEDQDLRQSVAEAARQFEPPTPTSTPAPRPTAIPPTAVPTSEAEVPTTGDPEQDADIQANAQIMEDLDSQIEDIEKTVQQLLELQLPIGWEYIAITEDMVTTSAALGLPNPRDNARNIWNYLPGNNPGWLGLLFQKLLGLITAAIAAAKGAPFWFDLLNKIARRGG